MNNKKKNLKKLIAEWDKKLKLSGFVDIEDRKTGLLKKCGGDASWDPDWFDDLSSDFHAWEGKTVDGIKMGSKGYSTFVWKQSQAEYYRLVSIYLHDKEFKTPREKQIWGYHAEGISHREIARKLSLTPRQVLYTINLIEKRFGLVKDE